MVGTQETSFTIFNVKSSFIPAMEFRNNFSSHCLVLCRDSQSDLLSVYASTGICLGSFKSTEPRVAIDKVRPDINGEIDNEEGYADHDDDISRFENEETPVAELAGDLELANKNTVLVKQVEDLTEQDTEQKNHIKTLEKEIESLRADGKEKQDTDLEAPQVQEEEPSAEHHIVMNRKEKRRLQKAKKQAEHIDVPKQGQHILFKENNTEGWKTARVVGGWKKKTKYQY